MVGTPGLLDKTMPAGLENPLPFLILFMIFGGLNDEVCKIPFSPHPT